MYGEKYFLKKKIHFELAIVSELLWINFLVFVVFSHFGG